MVVSLVSAPTSKSPPSAAADALHPEQRQHDGDGEIQETAQLRRGKRSLKRPAATPSRRRLIPIRLPTGEADRSH